MARRVPLNDPDRVIQVIAEDGGVILTGFSSVEDVQKVNDDAAPYLKAFRAEVGLPSASKNRYERACIYSRYTKGAETAYSERQAQLHQRLLVARVSLVAVIPHERPGFSESLSRKFLPTSCVRSPSHITGSAMATGILPPTLFSQPRQHWISVPEPKRRICTVTISSGNRPIPRHRRPIPSVLMLAWVCSWPG